MEKIPSIRDQIIQRNREAQEHKVTQLTNFCRVFEIPGHDAFPEGFCFGGGRRVNFMMVDWFNPVCLRPVGDSDAPETWEQAKKMLPDFIKGKSYYHPGMRYLVLTDFNEVLIIT